MQRIVFLGVVLVAFSAFSTVVVMAEGYWGFLTLAANEPWGLQVFLDLTLAMGMLWLFLWGDAREQGISPWPYLIATPFVGSMSPLVYLIHREIKRLVARASG